MADNKNMQDMLKQMSQQLNLSENELKSAAKKGNANSIFKNANSGGNFKRPAKNKRAFGKPAGKSNN